MNNKILIKENCGITLMALVITIIVLLILAGVTISVLTGDNGIIKKAEEAKQDTEYSQLKEEVLTLWYQAQGETIRDNLTPEEMADYFEKKLQQNDPNAQVEYISGNNTYEITYKDRMFEIQEDDTLTKDREDVIEDIENVWGNIDDSLSNEDKADKLEEELQPKDPDSTAEYNPDTGKIEVDHGGYESEVDPDTGEVDIIGPIVTEKAEVTTGEQEKYVSHTEDGKRTNSSTKMQEAHTVQNAENLEVTNFTITAENQTSKITANIQNKGTEVAGKHLATISILDEEGKEIIALTAYINETQPGATTQLTTTTTIDIANAYDYTITSQSGQ